MKIKILFNSQLEKSAPQNIHNKSLSAFLPAIIVFLIALNGMSPSGYSSPSTYSNLISTVSKINFVKYPHSLSRKSLSASLLKGKYFYKQIDANSLISPQSSYPSPF